MNIQKDVNGIKNFNDLNIPLLVRQTERDFSKIARETDKMKKEIISNVDNLFNNISKKKKDPKDYLMSIDVRKNNLSFEKIVNFEILRKHQTENKNNKEDNYSTSNNIEIFSQISNMFENKIKSLEEKISNLSTIVDSTSKSVENPNVSKTIKTLEKKILEMNDNINNRFNEIKEINQKKLIKADVLIKRKLNEDLVNEDVNHPTIYPKDYNYNKILNEVKEEIQKISKEHFIKNSEINTSNEISQNLREMCQLKNCIQCEKVNYSFGFIKCEICNKEKCKKCVMICKDCNNIYCTDCLKCPDCDNLSCLNCRKACKSCKANPSKSEKQTKYCERCLKKCIICSANLCVCCTNHCIVCKNNMCSACSSTCNICTTSACLKCGSLSEFTNCFSCKEINCKNCLKVCQICDLEVCTNCVFKCKNCNMEGCEKNLVKCSSCDDSFCNKCALALRDCFKCNFLFCETCSKDLVNCQKCDKRFCRKCYTVCRKCKNLFCLDCKIRCDNCKDISCKSCSYECACQKYLFCEKCLFDIKPICSHDCVFFINDKPTFSTSKTRSKLVLPDKFEAKFYIDKMTSKSFLIGLTDNGNYEEDSLSFIDNVWLLKPTTGEKYSTSAGVEKYITPAKEKDFIIISKVDSEIFFRINYGSPTLAFKLENTRYKDFYIYLENDSAFDKTIIVFVYIRKI